jgi:hypothetical protein
MPAPVTTRIFLHFATDKERSESARLVEASAFCAAKSRVMTVMAGGNFSSSRLYFVQHTHNQTSKTRLVMPPQPAIRSDNAEKVFIGATYTRTLFSYFLLRSSGALIVPNGSSRRTSAWCRGIQVLERSTVNTTSTAAVNPRQVRTIAQFQTHG